METSNKRIIIRMLQGCCLWYMGAGLLSAYHHYDSFGYAIEGMLATALGYLFFKILEEEFRILK